MQLPKLYANIVNKRTIDLTLSTNPLGCSPRAFKVLKNMTRKDLSEYPDSQDFLKTLANNFNVRPENIILGNGSEQLIKLIPQTFIQSEGQTSLVQSGSFALFTKESKLAGARVIFFNPVNPPDNIKPELIFLSNPSTPTGEIFATGVLKKLVSKFVKSIIVIDEANGEFNDQTFIETAVKSNNVLVLRTFSKVLGLAGVRIGVAFGPSDLISQLLETQQPFPVSTIAMKLAAAALFDRSFILKTKKFIAKERIFLTKQLKQCGLIVSDSVTNNLFVGSAKSKKLEQEFAKKGVSVIDGSFFPGLTTPGFRISIKDKKTNRLFIKKLNEIIASGI